MFQSSSCQCPTSFRAAVSDAQLQSAQRFLRDVDLSEAIEADVTSVAISLQIGYLVWLGIFKSSYNWREWEMKINAMGEQRSCSVTAGQVPSVRASASGCEPRPIA